MIPAEAAVEILYRDAWIIAVNKPSGLLVHRSAIDRHERRFALQEVRRLTGKFVYPVHRLDKPTSGVLLFAFDEEVAAALSLAFRNGEVEKAYVAVVRGYTDEEGCIDHPLKQMLDTKAQKLRGITKEAQAAKTYYRRLATVAFPYPVSRYPQARYSLVLLEPESGRKHQLRRHMKHIFHPIVGDTKHGRGEHNRLFREKFGINRLLLHAHRMVLKHPVTGKVLSIEAGFDTDFERMLQYFGIDAIE